MYTVMLMQRLVQQIENLEDIFSLCSQEMSKDSFEFYFQKQLPFCLQNFSNLSMLNFYIKSLKSFQVRASKA